MARAGSREQAPARDREWSSSRRLRKRSRTEPRILLEIRATASIVDQLVVRELDREGIEPEGLAVLAVIKEQGPLTPTALAFEAGYRLTTVSDIVQRLEQARRIRRRPNPDDGRSYLGSTTAEGDALLERAAPALRRALEAIERGWAGRSPRSKTPSALRRTRRTRRAS